MLGQPISAKVRSRRVHRHSSTRTYTKYPERFLSLFSRSAARGHYLGIDDVGAFSILFEIVHSHGPIHPDYKNPINSFCGCSTRKWHTIRDRLVAAGLLVVLPDGSLTVCEYADDIPQYRQLDVSQSEWAALRKAVLERDNYTCHHCGQQADSCDHVKAVVSGGLSILSNLVASCRPCNSSKRDLPLDEWKGRLQ